MNLQTLVKTNADRAVAVALVVVGAVALLLGWIGVSGVALAPQQIPYLISGGLGGIFLAAVGTTMWLSADLQDEWRRLDVLQETLSELVSQQPTTVPATVLEAAEPEPATTKSNGHARVRRVSKTLA